MSDLLNTGVSALLAYRKALDTAGHNIANVNTPGYTRQRVELASRIGAPMGDGYVGSGVEVQTVRRLGDALATTRLVADSSAYARADALQSISSQLDTLLSDSATGLAPSLNGFFDSLSAAAANPTATATRQALLGSAEGLAARFRELQTQVDGMQTDLNNRLRQTVDEVNQYSATIADLNDRIALSRGQAGGQPPNDLLDQRDQAIQELASRIGITTVAQDDGSINVFTASGQSLVLGKQVTALSVRSDEFDAGRVEVLFNGAPVTAQLSGGSLGGLLDARREVLDPAQAQLGRLAIALSDAMNAQHAQGTDARGQIGGALFTPPSGAALAAAGNAGTAGVAVSFDAPADPVTDEYLLRFDGSSWQLSHARSGAAVSMTGSGTAADPFRANGMRFTLSGSAAAGDRFLIQPTAQAAGELRVAITDPARVALASPLKSAANIANTGSATVASPQVIDADHADLLLPVQIQFTGPNSYSINGSGSFTYTPGQPLEVNGWSLSLSGTPATGDRFTVTPAGANSSDNGNAKALASLSTRGLLDGGRSSIVDAHAGLVAGVGMQARQAGVQKDAQAALLERSQSARDSAAGVNLDEEAADLLRFQQAYQAAAQVIAAADTVFQALLDATRR
jgi:flagellar hook-associated protein 1 FlgK